MNKNEQIATFDYLCEKINCPDVSRLPFIHQIGIEISGNKYIQSDKNIGMYLDEWLHNRNASHFNYVIESIYTEYGIADTFNAFITRTHAASLNDTFWVKAEDENVTWEDVSLYRKQYCIPISKISLGMNEHYDGDDFGSSPELLMNGSFRRLFENDGKDILFYKRGSYTGKEAYCEAMASEVASILIPDFFTPYSIVDKYGATTSCCKFFTNEDVGFIPYYNLAKAQGVTIRNIFDFYSKMGYEDYFRRMLILDGVIFNTDRHLGNFGVCINNDTLEILKPSKIFDLNLALFGSLSKENLTDFYYYACSTRPKIGDDFTLVAQRLLTPEIRQDLEKLVDFSFSFRGGKIGDIEYEDWRVKLTEEIIRTQVKAILSEESKRTKEVFKDFKQKNTTINYEKACHRAALFVKLFEADMTTLGYKDDDFVTSFMKYDDDNTIKVMIDNNTCDGNVTIDFMGKNISQSGKQFPEDVLTLITERTAFNNEKEKVENV